MPTEKKNQEPKTRSAEQLPLLSLLFLLITMQLGTSASYVGVGIFIISGLVLLRSEPRWRRAYIAAFRENPVTSIALALFVLIAVLVMLFQQVTSLGSWGEMKWLAFFAGMILPAAVIMRGDLAWENRWVRWMTWALIAVTLFSCFAAVYQFMTGDDPFRRVLFGKKGWNNRGHGLLKNPVVFAKLIGSLMLLAIPAFMVLRAKGLKRWSLFAAGISLVTELALIFSQSRGAWLALAVTGAAGVFLVPQIFRRVWLVTMVVAGVVAVGTIEAFPSLKNRAATIVTDNPQKANQTRLEQWHINWEILKENPLGVGFDGNDLREDYWYQKLGYEKRVKGHCHNEFIEIAVATGWPGLICYLVVTIMMLVIPVVMLRNLNLDQEPFAAFLLMSSLFVQLFLNGAVMTDQMDTQSRIMMCAMWALVMGGKVARS